jgi:hypothetical protein
MVFLKTLYKFDNYMDNSIFCMYDVEKYSFRSSDLMTSEEVNEVLDQLKRGERSEYHVSKEAFISFRKVLVNREEFKHFRGIAQRGGEVVYQYIENARS